MRADSVFQLHKILDSLESRIPQAYQDKVKEQMRDHALRTLVLAGVAGFVVGKALPRSVWGKLSVAAALMGDSRT